MNIKKLEQFNNSKITLNRKILNWEWYDCLPVFKLFIHCLLRANFKDEKWHGMLIERGQFVTSLPKLSSETGLTIKQVRAALNKLKTTKEVTYKATSQNSIITVNRYNEYQQNEEIFKKRHGENKVQIDKERIGDMQRANEGHAKGMQRATNKNDIRMNKNENILLLHENFSEKFLNEFKFWGEYSNVCLSDKQKSKLLGIVMNEKILNELINDLSKNIETKKEDFIDEKHPNLHYERLRAYWEFRRKNPNKFKNNTEIIKEDPYEELSKEL